MALTGDTDSAELKHSVHNFQQNSYYRSELNSCHGCMCKYVPDVYADLKDIDIERQTATAL